MSAISGNRACPEFNLIVERFYSAWFRFHPEAAVDVGVSGYEDLLTPHGDDDIGALIALNEKLLRELDTLDQSSLSDEQRIDYYSLYSQAVIELSELRESDWRYHNPIQYLPLNAINQLLFRSVEGFSGALKSRLLAIPNHLRSARSMLKHTPELIPELWLDIAVEEARQGVSFIRQLNHHPRLRQLAVELSMEDEREAAAQALIEFADFLEQRIKPLTKGDVACGKKHFERLLKFHHQLDISADDLLSLGKQWVHELTGQYKSLCVEYDVYLSCGEVIDEIANRSNQNNDLIRRYQKSLFAAEQFVRDKELLTAPPRQHLQVMETPVFLRVQIPFAAYEPPAVNDAGQKAWYWVTPVDHAGRSEHFDPLISHASVREGWPGHHVQFVVANCRYASRSLPRSINAASSFYEGWALYAEQLMFEQGFLHGLESNILLLRSQLSAALKIELDVLLHTGQISIDAAVQRMIDVLEFSEEEAHGEVVRCSLSPTAAMSGLMGAKIIESARNHVQTSRSFTLRAFHDAMLSCGAVALPQVIAQQLGQEVWQQTAEELFGETDAPT